jgi:hypothetical protein
VDAVTPSTNPLNSAGDELERLIQTRINDDMWKSMKGKLPCVDTSVACVEQLQQLAIANNRTLREIDTSIEEINTKIEEARKANKKAVELSIFRPLVQSYLQLQTVTGSNGQTQRRGFLNRILGIFVNPVDSINEVLSLVGIPLLDRITGTNAEAQRNAIAISDLQVKNAELMRGRADLAEKIRESVALQVLDFDTAAREFQISQVIAQREAVRMQLIEVGYRFGEGNTEGYLGQLSAMDGKKAATLRSWTQMRSRLERIKLLVLGERDEGS